MEAGYQHVIPIVMAGMGKEIRNGSERFDNFRALRATGELILGILGQEERN